MILDRELTFTCSNCLWRSELWVYVWKSGGCRSWATKIEGRVFIRGRMPASIDVDLIGIFDGFLDVRLCARCVAKVRFAQLGKIRGGPGERVPG